MCSPRTGKTPAPAHYVKSAGLKSLASNQMRAAVHSSIIPVQWLYTYCMAARGGRRVEHTKLPPRTNASASRQSTRRLGLVHTLAYTGAAPSRTGDRCAAWHVRYMATIVRCGVVQGCGALRRAVAGRKQTLPFRVVMGVDTYFATAGQSSCAAPWGGHQPPRAPPAPLRCSCASNRSACAYCAKSRSCVAETQRESGGPPSLRYLRSCIW